MTMKTEIKTEITKTYEFTYQEVIAALQCQGYLPPEEQISKIKIYFNIPSGGDYSGMSLELAECPLRATVTKFKVK